MKNKISDLRNHMFAALERLAAEDISDQEMAHEIERARAISEVGKVIVESAKSEVMYYKMMRKRQDVLESGFIDDDDAADFNEKPKGERPVAQYSNSGHLQVMKKYADGC